MAPTESSSISSGEDKRWFRWSLAIFGPGMFACLADTDAGGLITAGQSGARWGYSLLLLQIVLIPVLFAALELTIRLAIHTHQGQTAAIRTHFGPGWAWLVCALLLIECTGAMISELSGVYAVAKIWGFNDFFAPLLAALVVVVVVLFCNYRQIEIIGITCGLFELTFIVSMFILGPPLGDVLEGLVTVHDDGEYLLLLSSNIGAAIMPWMLYFQQSAVVARQMRDGEEVQEERAQTLLGSCLTQLVMIGTLVTMAAATKGNQDLDSVDDFVDALSPHLGDFSSKLFVSLAFLGGSLCAAFIVAITPAWAIGEAMGRDHSFSLDLRPSEAPLFYACFLFVVVAATIVLMQGVDIVSLNIYIQLMDALLMPMALGFVYILAIQVLPDHAKLDGPYKVLLGVVFSAVILIGFTCGIIGVCKELTT